ncbi:protein kinase [Actinomadura sp. LD22]|uniref:Protein kinase n=1 Tax=Actinomadura physcomitrii TaxID=2650748 RepID=A0A6I4MF58_9ACTN|nr:serine/threonine-protein kinase [Actinomadura physcomitrii]MWA02864.1 protein kinase [Actinomadura physcomitrii]
MKQVSALRPGDPARVGAYRVVGLLGEGGQGVVYRGIGPDQAEVAVKVLHARLGSDAKARERFAAELAHARQVAPFCTARVLDADLDGDQPYIVSEFIDGPSLASVIASGDVPAGPALQRLAIATVTALAAIHEGGVVHRDFKPGNVIMGADGARVIDFGIARALEATGTLTSAVVGTPAYMAPEQISGGPIGPAADIFAWGCTIAYAANGRTPFGQDSIPAVMHRILHEPPDLGALDGPLRDIVEACLAKQPHHRPAARDVLIRLLAGPGTAAADATAASSEPPTLPLTRSLLSEGVRAAAQGSAASTRVEPASAPRTPAGSRVLVRAAGVVAAVLAATTFLPWAKVGTKNVGHETEILQAATQVHGIETVWGVLTLIMAVAVVNIVISAEFTRRFRPTWAAVPGGLAVAAVAVFLLNKAALHSKNSEFNQLSPAELRRLGQEFVISIGSTAYIALAAAVLTTALVLVSHLIRRSQGRSGPAAGAGPGGGGS